MGKRGPKAQAKALVKSATISFRLSPEIRRQLEASAEENGRSLSLEITQLLEMSLAPDKEGGGHPSPQTAALAGLLAAAIWEAEKCTGMRWQRDVFTFDLARRTINQVLSDYEPRGPKRAPADFPSPRGATRADGNVSIVGERDAWPTHELKKARQAFLKEPDRVPSLIAAHVAASVHMSIANPSVPVSRPYRNAAKHLARRLAFDETPATATKPRRQK